MVPGPQHTLQADLFKFKYEQAENFQSFPQQPRGLISVDVFAKHTQIVSLMDKKAASWKAALDELIDKMGRPKTIMTGPDASIASMEISEWFKQNPSRQHTMTRHHSSFAERVLRMFKQLMYKEVKKDVRPWTDYNIPDVQEGMSEQRTSTDTPERPLRRR